MRVALREKCAVAKWSGVEKCSAGDYWLEIGWAGREGLGEGMDRERNRCGGGRKP